MFSTFNIEGLDQRQLFYKLRSAFSLLDFQVDSDRKAGIYAIFTDDICNYIGMSQNLASRLSQHLSAKYESCTEVLIFDPCQNGFDDFFDWNEEARKAILGVNEKEMMTIFKPTENLAFSMDFVLSEDESMAQHYGPGSEVTGDFKLLLSGNGNITVCENYPDFFDNKVIHELVDDAKDRTAHEVRELVSHEWRSFGSENYLKTMSAEGALL